MLAVCFLVPNKQEPESRGVIASSSGHVFSSTLLPVRKYLPGSTLFVAYWLISQREMFEDPVLVQSPS